MDTHPGMLRGMTTLILALILSFDAQAGSLSSISMPDTATVGGKALVLNGMGLREKYFIDIYVGGLYLPEKTTSDRTAIDSDVPKRIEMGFVYNEVTAQQLKDSFDESLAKLPNKGSVSADFAKLNGMMETVNSGDRIVFDYVPGTGTTITVKGSKKGTIAGAEFMKALWQVYLGSSPPTAKLKRGMLSG